MDCSRFAVRSARVALAGNGYSQPPSMMTISPEYGHSSDFAASRVRRDFCEHSSTSGCSFLNCAAHSEALTTLAWARLQNYFTGSSTSSANRLPSLSITLVILKRAAVASGALGFNVTRTMLLDHFSVTCST